VCTAKALVSADISTDSNVTAGKLFWFDRIPMTTTFSGDIISKWNDD
jgi:hypothetical protein